MGGHPVRLTVSASIISAQLLDLRDELERLHAAGADGVHIDLEDGRFAPTMGLGVRIVEAVAEWGRLPIDVHLMVSDPEATLRMLADLPIASIAVHLEATRYPRRVLRLVGDSGRRAGLAINPSTTLPDLEPLAPHLDYLLMLTTDPEHDDPPFLPARLEAVARLAAASSVPVIVDGGVSTQNAAAIARAGASGVVVGRALFGATDLADAVRTIATPGAAA